MTVKGLEGIGMLFKKIGQRSEHVHGFTAEMVLDTFDIGLLSGCINAKEGKKRDSISWRF